MSEPATLRTYAAIYAAPRRHERDGPLLPPTEADLAAAYALRLQADLIDVWNGKKSIIEAIVK